MQGNRNAFAQIVGRYQSVICAIAYSACGDIGRSEDLAQDTFIAAWRNLGDLKEPEKLKSWLCRIARNLINDSVRKQRRTPTAAAEPLMPETPCGAATPSDQAMSREEESLLWRALGEIPEIYREPMVLFYRESQSTQAVAAALELSEELVRKRLSRGREMVSERLMKTVEAALLKSSPGKTFTLGVMAALPALTISAKAAAIGATAAKGGAAAKSAGLIGVFGAIFGPVAGLLLPCVSYKLEMEDAQSAENRRFIRQFFAILIGGMVLFMVLEFSLIQFGKPLMHSHSAIYAGIWIGLNATYVVAVVSLAFWSGRRQKTMRREQKAAPREPAFEYRSNATLLGLPLVHVRMRGGLARGPVKAWFAAGDAAIGVIFAFGGVAVAPVSFGGLGIGLLTFGGFAIGAVAFGGFSLGLWAIGPMAVGLKAFGVCAIGWLAAQGWMAVAHAFAQGEMAFAAHANDAAAGAFFANSHFFQITMVLMRSDWLNLLWLVYLFPFAMWWRVKRKKRLAQKNPAGA